MPKFIKNPFDPDASFNGTMFETYGQEREYVLAQDPERVWTLMDNDEIIKGWHFVNRMGYFIAK